MKARIRLPLALLLLALAGMLWGCASEKQPNSSEITSFSYDYGSFTGGEAVYTLVRDGAWVQFAAVGYNGLDIGAEAKLGPEALAGLATLVNEAGIYRWDGFDKADTTILDGYGFTLEIVYADGGTVTAKGYMKYPEGYDEGHRRLAAYLGDIEAAHRTTE